MSKCLDLHFEINFKAMLINLECLQHNAGQTGQTSYNTSQLETHTHCTFFYNYSWAIEKDMIENLMKTGREV